MKRLHYIVKRLAILVALASSAVLAAPAIFVNDDGVLREITAIFVNDDGVLREMESVYVNDSGTLRRVFLNLSLDAGGGTTAESDNSSPWDTTVGIRFLANGTIQTGKSVNGASITWSAEGNWITPTSEASSAYDVRFTNFNGGGGGDWTTEATADNVWIALGSTRTYLMVETSNNSIEFDCDFEVRDGGGAPPATASGSHTFRITNTGA